MFSIFTVSAVLMACASNSPESSLVSNEDICEALPGVWEGAYEPESSGASISYQFELEPSGRFSALGVHTSPDGKKQKERQIGVWKCKGNVYVTKARNSSGKGMVYQYRVLEISQNHMKYQNFMGENNGPVFEARRTNAEL
jgi:hypothetical protein